VSHVVEVIAPARMGRSFRWLLASSWTSNIGDGIALAAAPLLVASQTDSAFLVALAALLQRLPWLLFGLYAGVLADRLDRRLVVAVADLSRAVVLAVVVATIATGTVSIAIVLVATFLLGVAEVFADTTATTLLPMLVDKRDLGIANARLMSGFVTANQLAGPPIGAALFAAGMAWPFATQAVLVALGAALITKIAAPAPAVVDADGERRTVRQDVADGFRWLWNHGPIRTLAITIVTFNVTFGAAWSVLVLYCSERLGLGAVGFGLVTTVGAIGGLVGTSAYGWLERRVSLGNIMRVGLIIETLTHLVLAITTTPWVAMVTFFVFGVHAFIWGTTSNSIRQRAVPHDLQGRVASVYMVGVFLGIVVGSAIGGVVADVWGITAPFWFALVGSALILAFIWRSLEQIAHADECGIGR
jgi:predicted MFS family arabinose efflux permease